MASAGFPWFTCAGIAAIGISWIVSRKLAAMTTVIDDAFAFGDVIYSDEPKAPAADERRL